MQPGKRSAHLAKAARTAYVYILIERLNEWAQDPSPENRRAVGKAMDRYAVQLRDGLFPVPKPGPFGTRGTGQRLGLPSDLPTLLQEARKVLSVLLEQEAREKAERIRDAKQRSAETQRVAREQLKAQNASRGRPAAARQADAPMGRLPWE